MFNIRFRWLWLWLGLALAACSGPVPQLIGSQPKQIGSSGYYVPAPSGSIIYNAYMEMEVADVDAAVQAAAQLARDYGGYLADGRLGAEDGWNTVTLIIPAAYFDPAHNGLLSLGRLIREDISGVPIGGRPGEGVEGAYSKITVYFRLTPGSAWRPSPLPGWNPSRTFERALTWFISIFTFLADVVIWSVVVGGPFVLMGWGARALWRRLRGKG
jgi:hypothetical protein